MAQMTIRINGYAYTVGCEDGQEEHLQAMADEVEARIEGIKASSGQGAEARLLVLAAILLADELHDAKNTLNNLKTEITRAPAPEAGRRRLAKLADRAEEIAATMEQPHII